MVGGVATGMLQMQELVSIFPKAAIRGLGRALSIAAAYTKGRNAQIVTFANSGQPSAVLTQTGPYRTFTGVSYAGLQLPRCGRSCIAQHFRTGDDGSADKAA